MHTYMMLSLSVCRWILSLSLLNSLMPWRRFFLIVMRNNKIKNASWILIKTFVIDQKNDYPIDTVMSSTENDFSNVQKQKPSMWRRKGCRLQPCFFRWNFIHSFHKQKRKEISSWRFFFKKENFFFTSKISLRIVRNLILLFLLLLVLLFGVMTLSFFIFLRCKACEDQRVEFRLLFLFNAAELACIILINF